MRGRRSWLFHLSIRSFLSVPFFAGDTQISHEGYCISKDRTAPIGRIISLISEKGNKNVTLSESVTESLTAPRRGACGGEASVFFMLRGLSEEQSGHP